MGNGFNGGFALLVVLFILLIIVGSACLLIGCKINNGKSPLLLPWS